MQVPEVLDIKFILEDITKLQYLVGRMGQPTGHHARVRVLVVVEGVRGIANAILVSIYSSVVRIEVVIEGVVA